MNEDNTNDILGCKCGKMIFHEECRETNKCLVCLITAYRQLEKDNERLQKALDKADPRGIYDDKKTAGGG